jgi:hypothetical protein
MRYLPRPTLMQARVVDRGGAHRGCVQVVEGVGQGREVGGRSIAGSLSGGSAPALGGLIARRDVTLRARVRFVVDQAHYCFTAEPLFMPSRTPISDAAANSRARRGYGPDFDVWQVSGRFVHAARAEKHRQGDPEHKLRAVGRVQCVGLEWRKWGGGEAPDLGEPVEPSDGAVASVAVAGAAPHHCFIEHEKAAYCFGATEQMETWEGRGPRSHQASLRHGRREENMPGRSERAKLYCVEPGVRLPPVAIGHSMTG